MYVCIFLKVTEWPPIGKIAAHSANDMFSWYKYLIVCLVFSHLGFWSGSLFLIAPFPDLCLLVLFSKYEEDPIKVEGARVATTQTNDFSNTQGQLTPQSEVRSS